MKNTTVNYKMAKCACFLTCLSTAVTSNLPPLLFITFRNTYGISYSMLGFLIVLNFGTQLLFDMLFSFFSHKFNISGAVRSMPVVMCAGLLFFAAAPFLPKIYIYTGIAAATVIFSAGAGLAEVLVSPTIAAMPSDNPERLMSRLHSCYAWGVLIVVVFSTVFISAFGAEKWQILTILLSILPLISSLLMAFSPLPPMETAKCTSEAFGILTNRRSAFYILCIFLGGASECTMSQWCSSYIEKALGINKTLGDICGFAMFGAMLGCGRSLYGKFGRSIHRVLFCCALGTSVCYITAAFSTSHYIGLAACAVTGLCTSMLWPGSLIAVTESGAEGGVALYALMAMGGDIGASVCPQVVGIITDLVSASPVCTDFEAKYHITAEQLGMKTGMAFAALFPITLSFLMFGVCKKKYQKRNG